MRGHLWAERPELALNLIPIPKISDRRITHHAYNGVWLLAQQTDEQLSSRVCLFVGSATSISVGQHVNLYEQIRP